MAGKPSGPRKNVSSSTTPIVGVLLGGAGLLILAVSVGILFVSRARREVEVPDPAKDFRERPPEELPTPKPPVDPPIVTNPKEPWWKDVPNAASIGGTVKQLQSAFPAEQKAFEELGAKSDIVRWTAYQRMCDKLPELLRNESARKQIASLLVECYALDPIEQNVSPIRAWFVQQIPRMDVALPSEFVTADIDHAFWSLELSLDALKHKSCDSERARSLSHDLGKAFEFTIDPSLPKDELKGRLEKLLAMRFYRNLLPTAEKSYERALAIRRMLMAKTGSRLSPGSRDKVDVSLAFGGLEKAKASWPTYSPLLQDCAKCEDAVNLLQVIGIYAQAEPELAGMMEPILAVKWNVMEDKKLTQMAKVKAIRKALGVPDPDDPHVVFAKLARETLANVKAPANQSLAILQETARLSHASTLACALAQKEPGLAKFEELIASVPELDMSDIKPHDGKDPIAKKTTEEPKTPMGEPKTPGGVVVKGGPQVFTDQLLPGVVSKIHLATLRRGKTYSIDMFSEFDNYLRLQNSRGQQVAQDDDGGTGLNAKIVFSPPVDETYRIVATSYGSRGVGPYTVSVQEMAGFAGPGFGPGPPFPGMFPGPRPFNPFNPFNPFRPQPMFPGPQPKVVGNPGKNPDKTKTPAPTNPDSIVDEADLKNLATNAPSYRTGAIKNIAKKLETELRTKDVTPQQAARIAKYLALGITSKSELEDILPVVAPLAKSRNVMLALADSVEMLDAKQNHCEVIVGTLVNQPLLFGKNDNWRLACRRLLLVQGVELTAAKKSAATEASEYVRDHYREQGLLLGMTLAELTPLTKPAQAIEGLIKHVAGNLQKNPTTANKEQLDQVSRRMQAAQFVAQDDLIHTAMLQRVWIQVLTMHLAQQHPGRAEAMRQIQSELTEFDAQSTSALEQLRAGEEKILRLWTLALDLK